MVATRDRIPVILVVDEWRGAIDMERRRLVMIFDNDLILIAGTRLIGSVRPNTGLGPYNFSMQSGVISSVGLGNMRD